MSFFRHLVSSQWRYVLIFLIVVGVGGYFFLGKGNTSGATLTITQSDFREQVRVSGTVIATQNVDLGFAANGRIAGTYARVGQHVEAGAILAETENGDLVATLAQKRSALLTAEANLASLRAGTRPEEVAVASTAVASAQAGLINAIQNAYTVSDDAVHNRADALFTNPRTNPKLSFSVANANLQALVERDRSAIEPLLAAEALLLTKLNKDNVIESARQTQAYLSQVATLLADANLALNQGLSDQTTSAATLASYGSSLAIARANVNTAMTTLTTATSAVDTAQSTLALKQAGSTTETISAQEAVVASASADVRFAEAGLTKTRVVAPFSGTVTRMDAKMGEIVSPTASGISMQSDGVFEVETYIPEVTITGVAVGNVATTTLDAYGTSVEFPATVVAVDPAETIKDGVPTYKTILAFRKADARIRSGMTTNVTLETGVLHDAIVIPVGAVGTTPSPYVSIIAQGVVKNRPVTLGSTPALGQAHILSGLSAGDVILLTPVP